MDETFLIRLITLDDVDVVARQRAAMFRDMASLPEDLVPRMQEMTRAYLREAIPRREYVGWVAVQRRQPQETLAGAGVQLRRVLPFPRDRPGCPTHLAHGRQAVVLNVYTEPGFRRRGLARALMYHVIEWARATAIESLVLHAAPAGRLLYEALGFVPGNEMRFAGDLSTWTRPL